MLLVSVIWSCLFADMERVFSTCSRFSWFILGLFGKGAFTRILRWFELQDAHLKLIWPAT